MCEAIVNLGIQAKNFDELNEFEDLKNTEWNQGRHTSELTPNRLKDDLSFVATHARTLAMIR